MTLAGLAIEVLAVVLALAVLRPNVRADRRTLQLAVAGLLVVGAGAPMPWLATWLR
jgi:hypothetical protein